MIDDRPSCFKANIEALRPRSPELASILEATSPFPLELLNARSGAMSARAFGTWLHSRYDPLAEARALADEAIASGEELVLILGLGLGYMARAALKAGAFVALIESDPAWMAALFEAVDMSDILGNGACSVILCPQGRGLLDFLYGVSPSSISVVENGATMSAFPLAASAFRSQIAEYRKKDDINAATLKRFGRLWVRNLAKNMGVSASCPGVSMATACFKGLPALVLAAGPSLDEALPALPELAKRMLTVCVDTALRSVLSVGVQPDFVMVVDPQFWNASHLDRCLAPHSVLVTEAAVWPSVLRLPFRRIIQCSSLYPLGRYVEDRMGPPKGSLGAGGSVATSAWDFARIMGCSPIYMAGLDLSFPDGRTHASASLFEQRALSRGARYDPASSESFRAMRGAHPVKVVANDGSEPWSDERLTLYSTWFERQMRAHPETASYTLSAKGIAIAGMPLETLDSLLLLPERSDDISRRLSLLLQEMDIDSTGGGERLGAILLDLLLELEAIATKADSAVYMAESAKGRGGEDISVVLKELERIDEELLASKARDVVGFMFSSARDIIGGRARTIDDSLEHTVRLYSAVAQSARWHASCLSLHALSMHK